MVASEFSVDSVYQFTVVKFPWHAVEVVSGDGAAAGADVGASSVFAYEPGDAAFGHGPVFGVGVLEFAGRAWVRAAARSWRWGCHLMVRAVLAVVHRDRTEHRRQLAPNRAVLGDVVIHPGFCAGSKPSLVGC